MNDFCTERVSPPNKRTLVLKASQSFVHRELTGRVIIVKVMVIVADCVTSLCR